MTSPEVVRVPVAHVRAHAGSVDEVAAGLATARDAGARVQLGGSAYGHLCAFLPAVMTARGRSRRRRARRRPVGAGRDR